MKKIILLFFFFQAIIGFSQTKDLSLEDAVLAYYKGLYPKNVTQLNWLTDVDKYRYTTDTSILVKTPQNCVVDIEIFADSLYGTNGRVPGIIYMDNNRLVYKAKNDLVEKKYRLSNRFNDTNTKIISLPASSANHKYFTKNNLQVAFTIDNNVSIINSKGEVEEVTAIDDKNIVSGQAIHRYEFGISDGLFWSPDGTKLAFYQKDETDVADYPLLDINETPGKLNSIKYPMAGQKSEYAKVGIYDLTTKELIYLRTIGDKDSYLTNLTWGPNSEYIYLAQLNRGQNQLYWNQYDVKTGRFKEALIYEMDSAWVEPEYPLFFSPIVNANQFYYLSEYNGTMALYSFTIGEKQPKLITDLSGVRTRMIGKSTVFENYKFPITGVEGFNSTGQYFYFTATGPDPKNNLGYRVDVNTGNVQLITPDSGQHQIHVSPTGNYITDSYTAFGLPRKVDIVNLSKKKIQTTNILLAENPLKDYKLGKTEFITLISKDSFNLHGRIIYPHDYVDSSDKKYPVLVYVYGGPHAQLVTNDWLGGASLWMHWMANQGYIVFTLDNRGSANRGYDFEKVIHRELGKNEMEDQILGVDYLKKRHFVDANRIAVHGWSFGGFMTTSLMLKYPDVFTTGVAGGPVMDWKWYEVMYGERYMDTPEENPEGYKNTSTLNFVKNLKGKLLTIHGTVDDVVVMQHNLAFIQECVNQGIQTDFFPYPMHPHNVRGKDRVHLMTKVLNYIIENNK